MNIERLPQSQTETPCLYARVNDNNEVVWTMDDNVLGDEHNWFQVWRRNDVIHVEATMWFTSRGAFGVHMTDETPDHCVILTNEMASLAARAYEGDGNPEFERLT